MTIAPSRRQFLALLTILATVPTLAQAQTPTKRNSIERLAPARLKATHEDVLKLQAARQNLPPRAGLTDFRGIFHAHAEDSAHTGGTRPEMLAEAKKAGVQVIFLSNHHRPPTDFINDSWRGVHDGVLFIPGSEARGFLIAPNASVMSKMEQPTPEFVKTIGADGGLIFLSHIEERPDHSMLGLNGLEIYNRHYDAKKDKSGVIGLVLKMTDPRSIAELQESLRLYPDETFAFHCEHQADYIAKWDKELKERRLTGVAANDCHHNQILLTKMVDEKTVLVGTNVDEDRQMQKVTATLRPGIRKLTEGHKPGDIVAKVDLDPYHRSFRNVSTHILASKLDEPTIREAVRAGHVYVSHDWICDPTGFSFEIKGGLGQSTSIMGDEIKIAGGLSARIVTPAPCKIRLFKDGEPKNPMQTVSRELTIDIDDPGVYRVEAWVTLDGEDRPWIYSNPIYVR